ncbi:unnamed protein product, partial [Rotaria magnacalcarata]
MSSPQYLGAPDIIGGQPGTIPSNINPGSPGIDFSTLNGTVVIPLAPGITPIVTTVSIPNPLTNVV